MKQSNHLVSEQTRRAELLRTPVKTSQPISIGFAEFGAKNTGGLK